jgi:hypothetical protein
MHTAGNGDSSTGMLAEKEKIYFSSLVEVLV